MEIPIEQIQILSTNERVKRPSVRQRLIGLRDDWSDEIPDFLVQSDHRDEKYGNRIKVRTAWQTVIIGTLRTLVSQGRINDSQIIKQIDAYTRRFAVDSNNPPKEREMTTPDQIAYGNSLLSMVIDYLPEE